jgi:hypothetical protein
MDRVKTSVRRSDSGFDWLACGAIGPAVVGLLVCRADPPQRSSSVHSHEEEPVVADVVFVVVTVLAFALLALTVWAVEKL